jgi:hypothetical protein
MRNVTYRELSHGVLGDAVEASLPDFLLRLPYVLGRLPWTRSSIPLAATPPLFVLNDVLAKGVLDAGMSGGAEWEPFQITAVEWEELASAIGRAHGFVVVEPPAWVRTYPD